MRRCGFGNKIIGVALVLCLCLPLASARSAEKGERAEMRILYAGLQGTDRAKDFVDFLGEHFATIETTDYNTFTGSQAAGFDVTIIDHDGADTRAPRLRLSPDYTGAAITVGVPGAFICSGLGLKTAYL